jgi:hypothetical protein
VRPAEAISSRADADLADLDDPSIVEPSRLLVLLLRLACVPQAAGNVTSEPDEDWGR